MASTQRGRENSENDPTVNDPSETIASWTFTATTPNGVPRSRQRVSVACQRCRSRKLKCTPPSGHPTACGTCTRARTADTCRFTRVRSMEDSTIGQARDSSRLPETETSHNDVSVTAHEEYQYGTEASALADLDYNQRQDWFAGVQYEQTGVWPQFPIDSNMFSPDIHTLLSDEQAQAMGLIPSSSQSQYTGRTFPTASPSDATNYPRNTFGGGYNPY